MPRTVFLVQLTEVLLETKISGKLKAYSRIVLVLSTSYLPSGGASFRMRLVRKLLSAGRSSIIFISTYTQQAKLLLALSERYKTTQLQKQCTTTTTLSSHEFIKPSITNEETMLNS